MRLAGRHGHVRRLGGGSGWKTCSSMMNAMTKGANHFLNSLTPPNPLGYWLLEMPHGWEGRWVNQFHRTVQASN